VSEPGQNYESSPSTEQERQILLVILANQNSIRVKKLKMDRIKAALGFKGGGETQIAAAWQAFA
jgi:hypothetical protein